jgi:exopolysaccharide biosynthesis polyprenyl glycosylphosphotransferase
LISAPEALREYLSRTSVREVFASAPELSHVTLLHFAEVCEDAGVPFKVIPDLMELRMGEIVFDDSLGLPSFSLRPATLAGSTYLYKRVFDVILSVAAISGLIVPFAFLAFLIRMDSPGPILFRQRRVGLRGRPFGFLKFRSMVEDAERRLDSLKDRNERTGPVFKIKDDPRVTRVGRWLRKLSLDEFPQLLNVLRGEMSLVGPRPQLPAEIAEAGEIAKRRMNVLPGITGLWQVSGRARLSYEQMVELDTYYIEHWSPGLDLTILVKTLPAVLGGRGAY